MPTEHRKIIYKYNTPEQISALVAEAYEVKPIEVWQLGVPNQNYFKLHSTSVDACLELARANSLSVGFARWDDGLISIDISGKDKHAGFHSETPNFEISAGLCIALLRHKGWEVVV